MSPNNLEVDPASYITLEAAIKVLNLELKKQHIQFDIQSIKTLYTSVDASLEYKRLIHRRSDNKGIFMGRFHDQIHYTNTNSFRLAIDEITNKGELGERFYITLHSKFADEWQNNLTAKSVSNKIGNALIVFENLPYQVKSQTIEFHMVVPREASMACSWIKVKQYFSTFVEAKSENYAYTSLYNMEKKMDTTKEQKMKCNLYAVIHSKVIEPNEGKQGKGKGMYVVVDPSCYQDMIKQREYCAHIFTSSLGAFPKIETGDIIRMHRAVVEIRPRDGLPDVRVFRENDIVVFPWNDEEKPRCSANRFTITTSDVEHVQYLKTWSLERYRKPVETLQANVEATNKNPITLSEIKLRENFNLSCRLVDFFEEENGVALWVEDGTQCPLFTVSDTNIGPYDSQDTQNVHSDCLRICIRCSKLLLGNLNLQHKMLLYLREVVQSIHTYLNVPIAQFEIIGAIESLPLNTRYHKSLMQRLTKAKVSTKVVEQNVQPVENIDVQTETQHPINLQPITEDSFIQEPGETNIGFIPQPLQTENEEDNSEEKTSSQKDVIDNIISSGECSTDRAMKDIPSDFFDQVSPPSRQLVREDFQRESQRLQLLIHPELKESETNLDDSELMSRFRSQNLASLEDMHFSQAIASTQKPPRYEIEDDESNDADHSCLSASQEIPNAQRILSPAESESSAGTNKSALENPPDSPIIDLHFGRRSHSTSMSLSPHPVFRAVDEVLEIKTNCRSNTNDLSEVDHENQLNTSIDVPLFRSRLGKGDQISNTATTTTTQRQRVVERVTFGEGDQEEIVLIASKSQQAKVLEQSIIKNRRTSSESSSDSIVEIDLEDHCQKTSQEWDKESVIILDPSSQQDLEKIFCLVEEAQMSKKHLQNLRLEEVHTVQPGERFRVTATIGGLLPKPHVSCVDDPVGLKNLLVAFCLECKHLWQYHQFINSVSTRVMQRWTLPTTSTKQDDMCDYVVVNYLCSKEEHTRNLRLLVEGTPNLNNYEYDEFVFLNKSYHYICPYCDSRKIPHSLCSLTPSFFFRMHVTEKSTTNADDEPSTECLHILATGVHAEYFLGTKADHVLRSQEIWKRAEQRITKLMESQQTLTLGLIRRVSNPNEICLEHTKTVFASNHVLPWRSK